MEPFKNALSFEKAAIIAGCIHRVYRGFSLTDFRRGLESALEPLELKQRVHCVADRIESGLPNHPPELFKILVAALGDSASDDAGLRGFLVWPLTEIVARRGLDFFDDAMATLREMTRRFTAEFAIRPFLRVHQERTLAQLHRWCDDPDEHVRRLVSEGSRPLLPWGERLPALLAKPDYTLPLLERLRSDPSDYVRLSVSNHLNDFSKAHAEIVIETLARWRKATPADARLEKLSRHACRTLLKKGHAGALALHGFGTANSLTLEACTLLNPAVKVGEALEYRLIVKNTSRSAVRVMFDYAILHRKANGTQTPKVFKGRTRELAPGESWEIEGRHSLKPVTTRVYYSGPHGFEPRLNGKSFPAVEFDLTV